MNIILLSVLALATVVFLILLLNEKRISQKQRQDTADSEIGNADALLNLNVRIAKLNEEISKLSAKKDALELEKVRWREYEHILDAEGKANEIIREANLRSQRIKDLALEEANNLRIKSRSLLGKALDRVDKSNKEALLEKNKIVSEAIEKGNVLILVGKKYIYEASIQVNNILNEAQDKATFIYNEAKILQEKSKLLENAVEAMKNIIEGYGDQYIVPPFDLLDKLADEYSHTIAGDELRACRTYTRWLIKNKSAAKCDYSDEIRKQAAMNFILDAFNGKVDSILSSLRKDNYGTLSQKIKDAFAIVNINGQVFRNTMITNQYLMSRLEELKWAATIQEIKLNEREEQRLIKEQIREEEKVRRDFEKAHQEAQREEFLLKTAMARARLELDNATEAQRAKYELQLEELSHRLTEAEEKNRRAISMAQQTKTGHVYIISNIGSFGEDVYKIGMTRRLEPLDRVKELGGASVPFEFDVHAMLLSDDAPHLERELHKRFVRAQVNKANARKEFFKISLADIKQVVEEMGIHAKWTQISEAKEYRESLAILEGLRNHTIDEQAWVKRTIEHIPAALQEEEEEENRLN